MGAHCSVKLRRRDHEKCTSSLEMSGIDSRAWSSISLQYADVVTSFCIFYIFAEAQHLQCCVDRRGHTVLHLLPPTDKWHQHVEQRHKKLSSQSPPSICISMVAPLIFCQSALSCVFATATAEDFGVARTAAISPGLARCCFIVEDSIEATALPIFTARRGVAGIYIILELLDLSCMSMSMDATVLIKSVQTSSVYSFYIRMWLSPPRSVPARHGPAFVLDARRRC